MKTFSDLPVYDQLNEISAALDQCHAVLISAEPGAGKTMLVPVLVNERNKKGLTILVEPRRIAARAAAYGIAGMHGFSTGKETGFSVRGESCRCKDDGILAVTPGILLQMLQNDPALENVSAVVFDEFHERSLEYDLALTLILDIRDSLRDDLELVIMSATVDTGKISDFINAPAVSIPGRNFPVEICYQECSAELREMPRLVARCVLANLDSTPGNILVFLPGAEEIRQCGNILEHAVAGDSFAIHLLHASLPFAEQRAALAPDAAGRRKIILATNVAESSLTIDNITCVIDSGWEKQSRWHPGSQMSFLETRRITKASAIQRAGRAGRTSGGKAVRCYNRFTFEQFADFPQPEIITAELSRLVLSVSCWGAEISALRWLDAPPLPAVNTAKEALRKLALFTPDDRPTAAGKRAASLPVSPRIAAMMIFAPPHLRRIAAKLAAILEEKDDFYRFNTADLQERISRMQTKEGCSQIQRSIISRLLKEFPPAAEKDNADPGILIAAAFPEWIGRNRSGNGTVFQLANGSAATLKEDDFLRKEQFLAIAPANAAIRLAIPVTSGALEEFFAGRITEKKETFFDSSVEKLVSFSIRALDQLPLNKRPIPVDREMVLPALLKEAERRGIPLPPAENKRAVNLLARLKFARNGGMDELPDMGNIYDFLAKNSGLFPNNINTLNDLRKVDYFDIFHSAIDYRTLSEADRLVPEYFIAPSGHKFAIDYSGEQPTAGVIIQELYPLDIHPTIGRNRIPLRLELLSPARRPVQITSDLPGFWNGSWELVRAEMRSRYPKHNWDRTADPGKKRK